MKGIIFTENIGAIVDGRKTQTRRVMKKQPIYDFCFEQGGEWFWTERDHDDDMMGWWPSYEKGLKPRYKVGETVYLKETWANWSYDIPESNATYFLYRANYPDGAKGYWYEEEQINWCDFPKWRPSIFMPREAARIFLRITAVRAERLQDITYDDARAEGIDVAGASFQKFYKGQFKDLWNKLHAKNGNDWGFNPWVWVYEFERVADLMPADNQGLQDAAQPALMYAT